MASGVYNQAFGHFWASSADITDGTYKWMLLGVTNGGYVFDPDHTVVDNGANNSTDPSFNELLATGYTTGFASVDRVAPVITSVKDDSTNTSRIFAPTNVWTALGNGTNDTATAAILWKPVTNDADSLLIAYVDITNTTTDSTDLTVLFDQVNGIIDGFTVT